MHQEIQQFDTPILFLLFNRPDLTETVFRQIRKVQPSQLFIVADGPRITHPEDIEKCAKTKKTVLEMIDWDCDTKTLFRDKNLGCGLGISQAITWFFSQVESGIILEDDIYPDESFFLFSNEMLRRYKTDQKVLFISGSNFQLGNRRGDGDYYYSKFPNTWGWATWRDRWKFFDYNLYINEKTSTLVTEKVFDLKIKKLWLRRLNEIKINRKNIWDYQWFTNIYLYDKWSVVPNRNLVKNIGIGSKDATNTHGFSSNYLKVVIEEFVPPYSSPTKKCHNKKADIYHFEKFFKSKTSFINHLRNIAYSIIPNKSYQKIKSLFGR